MLTVLDVLALKKLPSGKLLYPKDNTVEDLMAVAHVAHMLGLWIYEGHGSFLKKFALGYRALTAAQKFMFTSMSDQVPHGHLVHGYGLNEHGSRAGCYERKRASGILNWGTTTSKFKAVDKDCSVMVCIDARPKVIFANLVSGKAEAIIDSIKKLRSAQPYNRVSINPYGNDFWDAVERIERFSTIRVAYRDEAEIFTAGPSRIFMIPARTFSATAHLIAWIDKMNLHKPSIPEPFDASP